MRTINNIRRKRIITILIFFIIIVCTIGIVSFYIADKSTRDWIDINILKKNITEQDIQTINLNTDKNNQVHVYSRYIALLNDKIVGLYNAYGEKVSEIDVNINTAVFDSSDKYLALAEKNGHEICLILDKTYLWSTTVEGEILQIYVNRNGYVGVVTTDVTHKSILTVYNSEGKKLFTSYFSSTRIIDASISDDNKYIAIGELDTSGAIIKSCIKIISVENAQKDTENAIYDTHNLGDGILLANVEYQGKGQVSCIYDNGIGILKSKSFKEIVNIDNEKVTYMASDLRNHIVYIEEENTGLFKAISNLHIVNTADNHENIYKVENTTKELYANDDVIAINVGTEIYFVNTSGWLLKKYTANQEITNVKFSDSIAAIVYKDKIVIVDL